MSIFGRNYEEEGHDIPMPERGIKRFFAIFFTHFWKLVGVNILFVLFSLPIVTLPASLCAMNRVLIKLVRDGNVLLWPEFRDEFKADIFPAMLPGLLFSALIFGACFFMSMAFGNVENPLWCLAFWVAGVSLLLAGVCVGEFYFVMKAELDLSGMALMKNAVLLALVSPGFSLAGLAIIIAALFVLAAFMPAAAILILFILPAMTQYAVCYIINGVIQKKIIGPYEQMHSESADLP